MPLTDGSGLRVAVTGREGQVVRSLVERGAHREFVVIPLGRPVLDLTQPATVIAALRDASPDLVVNAAAYTAVDKAEGEPDVALAVNGGGARAVAEAAASLGTPIIHISTDYVFDGCSDRAYRPGDPTCPLGAYGRSKLAGEEAVAVATGNHVILRTAWVYSPFGANFVKTMLRLAQTRQEISVVSDQHGCPTDALAMADGILSVARNVINQPENSELRGIFHMVGAGETTWAQFAEAVFAISVRLGGQNAKVHPITSAEYPTPAKRPMNSRLDGTTLHQRHGVALPRWELSVEACVARLLEAAA